MMNICYLRLVTVVMEYREVKRKMVGVDFEHLVEDLDG